MRAVYFHKASLFHGRLLTTMIGLAALAILSGALAAWLDTDRYAATHTQIQATLATRNALIHSLQTPLAPAPRRAGPSPQVLTTILDNKIRAIVLPVGSTKRGARTQLSYRRLLADWRDEIRPGLERFFRQRRVQYAGLDRVEFPQPRAILPPRKLELALGALGADLARLNLILRQRAASQWGLFDLVQYAALCLLLGTAVWLRRTWTTSSSGPSQDKRVEATPIVPISKRTHHADALKVEDATHTSASLALLQTVLDGFFDDPESPESFLPLLREIECLIGAKSSAIFIITRDSNAGALPLVCTDPAERACFVELLRGRLPATGLNSPKSIQTFADPVYPETRIIAVQLAASDGLKKGMLLVKRQFGPPLSSAEKALLRSLGKHLAAIICSAQRAQANRRVALCEERAVIARELHDSLAQSLSYLKIQTSRLQSLLHPDTGNTLDYRDADAVLQELRTNLNLAYRQLREIITTFRLTMNGRSLGLALKDSMEEFEHRSSVAFTLDNRVPDGLLSVDDEIHVLQIVRECVCNVVRHAQARRSDVSLDIDATGVVRVTVDDDGVGMDAPRNLDQHHGLVIMQQRAHGLGGDMRVARSPDGGTRVRISFASHRPNADVRQLSPFTQQTQP